MPTVARICAAYGLPPSMLNWQLGSAAMRESMRAFNFMTLAPISRLIEADIKRTLAPDAVVHSNDFLSVDSQSRARAIKAYTDAGVDLRVALAMVGSTKRLHPPKMPATLDSIPITAAAWTDLTAGLGDDGREHVQYPVHRPGASKFVTRGNSDGAPAVGARGFVLWPGNKPDRYTLPDGFKLWGRVHGIFPTSSEVIAEST